MGRKTLKGLTIKIGGDTSSLNKALDKVDKKSKDLSSELGEINRLLKLDPKNTELLAQKQKVLADAISNTESKLGTLREAEKQVQEQFERGEVSEEQYRALQREIVATEKNLDGYKKASQETADAVKDVGKASNDAEDAVSDMGDSAKETAKNGLTAIVEVAAAVVGAIVAMDEASREYRTEMGKLNTAFVDAGHSGEVATQTYKALQGVLGETDQAVEAANHLAKLCDAEEDLAQWTEIATGVYATFGSSLPIEGLAEAANETVRVGQVTGPLADALNWAAEEGETFGVKMREATEANEEWNKAVETATSAEDYFNLALQECSTEQERQQLITKTLTKLYKNAATQYKNTNKEVIRANKATEKWNETTAQMGAIVEPAVTDIKEFGIALLEDIEEPLKAATEWVRNKFLPALKDFSGWVKQNIPAITSGVVGLTAVWVTYKAAVLATELASKGLTVATLAQAAAQKALDAVMAASPWGLVATAIVGVAAALVTLVIAMGDAKEPIDLLTEEERKLMAAADEAAQAFRDQKAATDETLGGITSQMDHVQDLADELQELAGSSGRVLESDKERAQFILNELNEALGTEYTMTGNVIQQYSDLKKNIDEVIQSKLANSLIEAANADYVTAIQNEAGALENLNLKEQDYQAQLGVTQEARSAADEAWKKYNETLNAFGVAAAEIYLNMAIQAESAWETENGVLAKKKSSYDQAAVDYGNYYNTIANYEEAQTAVLAGNYEKAVDILAKKGGSFGAYSDKVDKETAKVLDTLYKEAIDAGLEAERTKRNFEKGVDGYTEEMVREAEKGYEETMDAFASAYADAESVGEDIGDGASLGMESRRGSLYAKARSLVSGIISAMRSEADSHSPARKTIDFGEDVGEGAEIGIENKTEDVRRAATDQAAAILDAYRSQEVAGQKALRNVADRQSAMRTANRMTAATANSAILNSILEAIKAGQVLFLDGDALVGGTVDRFNYKLGQLQVLAARGAK